MNFKYLLLLILFVFNFTSTVVADSSHIDVPSQDQHKVSHDDHTEHYDVSNNDNDAEHCQDHDCCHHSHVHYYLMVISFQEFANVSIAGSYPAYLQVSEATFLDIIKPPLV